MTEVATESGVVTFVGGKAESQTTEGEGSGIAVDERDAAVAAVKEALKKEARADGEKAAKQAKDNSDQDPLRPRADVERGADGKFLKSGKDPVADKRPEPTVEEDGQNLKRVLAERKQIASQKEVQRQELAKQTQQLQQAQRQLQAQQAELDRREARMNQLRSDPIRAIKENGWDPESFILDIAQDGTPEGQRSRQQRELQAQYAEMKAWKAEQERVHLQNQERQQQAQRDNHRANVEQSFVALALNEAKHPHLAAFYTGHEAGLVAEGDSVADQYRNLTGKEASGEEIAEYLEERAATWYKSMSAKAQGATQATTKTQVAVPQGRSTQGSATGRTLSPDDSSERRSLGKSYQDLDGEERLAVAREAVGAALRASGETR